MAPCRTEISRAAINVNGGVFLKKDVTGDVQRCHHDKIEIYLVTFHTLNLNV